MYSYFVWLSMPDGAFIRLNVCSGLSPDQVNRWLGEFFKAVDARLKQLRRPERVADAFRFRIISDPSHADLCGEFPGRANYNPHDAVDHAPRGWPYPGN